MSLASVDPGDIKVIAGRYEIVRLLGRGGMGAVYEGRNVATLKRCAIKLLLSPEFGANAELVKRFFREAKASSIIESDHIVQVYDSGYDQQLGWPFMVMELLNGEDLEGTLKRVGALHPLAAAKAVLQASIGLAKAHEAGIVHRDIKPANLFLTARDSGDYLVKLLDFGIAKVKMENLQETSNGLTRTGSMLGTPLYMSPEQVNGDRNIDARSDVWSLGIVLFELLSGNIPWEAANSLGRLMASILTEDIPLLQDRAPWVAPELAEVVHRAISRDPNKRFKNAGELRDALFAIVPDGPRITAEMLQPVPGEHRAWVAPRLAVSDDGMLRATTRTGLTTQSGTTKKGSAVGAVAAVVLGVAVLGGGGFAGYRLLLKDETTVASAKVEAPPPPPPPPQTIVQPVEAPPPKVLTFPLAVGPAGVTVKIDGKPAKVEGGNVQVEGIAGSSHQIELTFKGKSEEQTVGIMESGVIPPKLEFAKKQDAKSMAAVAAIAKPKSGGGSGSSAGAGTPKESPKSSPAEKAQPKQTGLVKDTGEF